MAKSHLNQAKEAMAAVNCVVHMVGWKKDRPNTINCPICGGKAFLGRPEDGRLVTRAVCMGKDCKAQRRAFKVRSEKGRLVLDK